CWVSQVLDPTYGLARLAGVAGRLGRAKRDPTPASRAQPLGLARARPNLRTGEAFRPVARRDLRDHRRFRPDVRGGEDERRSRNPRPAKIAGIAFSIRAVRVADCFAPVK